MEGNVKRKITLMFSGIDANGYLEIKADKDEEVINFINELKNNRNHEIFHATKDDILLIHPE